jgi:hypothetical protein
VPSSAIGSVLENVLGSVLESVLGSVLESNSEVYLGACNEVHLASWFQVCCMYSIKRTLSRAYHSILVNTQVHRTS